MHSLSPVMLPLYLVSGSLRSESTIRKLFRFLWREDGESNSVLLSTFFPQPPTQKKLMRCDEKCADFLWTWSVCLFDYISRFVSITVSIRVWRKSAIFPRLFLMAFCCCCCWLCCVCFCFFSPSFPPPKASLPWRNAVLFDVKICSFFCRKTIPLRVFTFSRNLCGRTMFWSVDCSVQCLRTEMFGGVLGTFRLELLI